MMNVLLTILVGLFCIMVSSSPCETTGSNCITTCKNRDDGDYQSCNGCNVYASCSGGYIIDNRPCPGNTVWDDDAGMCLYTSLTCQCIESGVTTTTTTTTTTPTTTQSPDPIVVSVDGEWGIWGPYTDCSVSCGLGGEKSRIRSCDSPVPEGDGLICSGYNTDIVSCNEGFICPDCSRTCASGTLNNDCTLCECNNQINGRVKSGTIGLANVEIRDVNQQWLPVAVTDNQGNFEINGFCSDSLQLIAVKQGYGTDQSYYPVNSAYILIQMNILVKPEIISNPTSQVAYAGETITLICKASHMTNIEWFLDGAFLSIGSLNGQVSELAVTAPGTYKCRAVSSIGKMFSTSAQATFISAQVADSCSGVKSKYVALQPTCTYTDLVNIFNETVDIGTCGSEYCISTYTSGQAGRKCCTAVGHTILQITCDGFSYQLVKVTQCGCSVCAVNDAITISGKLVGDNFHASSSNPTVTVSGYNGPIILINYLGEFTFVIQSKPIITIMITERNLMKQLTTIETQQDLHEYHIVITVLKKPAAQVVSSLTENEVDLVSNNGQSNEATISFPPNSFQLQDGSIYNGDVKVYASFNDPRNLDSMMSASAQFSFVDDEGTSRLLQTFGVATITATNNDGQDLEITGKLTITINAANLGVSSISGPTGALLWTVNLEKGNWEEYGNFNVEQTTNKRRRRSNAQSSPTVINGTIEIPSNLPWINIDRKLLKNRCYISVKVTMGPAFIIPIGGVRIIIYIYDNGVFVNRMLAYSDNQGNVCVPVVCGLDHAITVNYYGQLLVHPTHKLPTGFVFTNLVNGVMVKAIAPVTQNQANDGPIHRDRYKCINSLYYFQLGKPIQTLNDYGDLNVVEPLPNKVLSWQPNSSPNYTVCAVSFGFTSSDRNLRLVGTSSNSNGQSYGTFSAKLKTTHYKDMIESIACVLVRCPTSSYTDIELQIASTIRNNCTLTHNFLNSGAAPNGTLDSISYTNTSYNLRINTFNKYIKKRHIHIATESTVQMARFKVLQQCEYYNWNKVANYRCKSESNIPSLM